VTGPAGASPCSRYRPCLSIVTVNEDYLPAVTGVAVIGDHRLRLLFSDGTAGDVDFSGEQWTGVLEPLNDPAYFARVIVDTEGGTIARPGGIDLAQSRFTSRHVLTPSSRRKYPANSRLP
jgi:hypothetical protein